MLTRLQTWTTHSTILSRLVKRSTYCHQQRTPAGSKAAAEVESYSSFDDLRIMGDPFYRGSSFREGICSLDKESEVQTALELFDLV